MMSASSSSSRWPDVARRVDLSSSRCAPVSHQRRQGEETRPLLGPRARTHRPRPRSRDWLPGVADRCCIARNAAARCRIHAKGAMRPCNAGRGRAADLSRRRYGPLREIRLLSPSRSGGRRCPLVRRRESSLKLHQRGSAKLLRPPVGQRRRASSTSGAASAPASAPTEWKEPAPRAGSRGNVGTRSTDGVRRGSLLPAQLSRPLLVWTHRAGAS